MVQKHGAHELRMAVYSTTRASQVAAWELFPQAIWAYAGCLEEGVVGLTPGLQQDLLPLGWGVVFLATWLEAHEFGGSIPPRSVLLSSARFILGFLLGIS